MPLTPFPELDVTLAALVESLRAALGDDLLAAGLGGSFALGDGDAASDVDLLIAVREDLSGARLARLQAIHAQLFATGPQPWARRLEGSYVPAAVLRTLEGQPRDPPGEPRAPDWADPCTSGNPPRRYPFWFLANGADALVRSEHDNSWHARWIARETAIPLFGPPLRTLIDPVQPDALRAEARDLLLHEGARWTADDSLWTEAWLPAFWAPMACRLLYTITTAAIASKPAACAWARPRLPPRFHPLIDGSLAFRHADRARWREPADPAQVEGAQALLTHVLQLVAS